jgi:hypothetical protein
MQWIGGWVGPKTGLDYVEKRKLLTLLGLELLPLCCPACSQSLYRLCYPGSLYIEYIKKLYTRIPFIYTKTFCKHEIIVITKFLFTTAMKCQMLHEHKLRNTSWTSDIFVFQCNMSILWVMIIFWYGYVKCNIQSVTADEHESLYKKCWDFPLNYQWVLSNQLLAVEVSRSHQLLSLMGVTAVN